MAKKLAVLGRGTAGSLAMCQAWHYQRMMGGTIDVDWYFDDNIKPQAVGEGSTLILPMTLLSTLGFLFSDLHKVDGTFKAGIRKVNWSAGGDYIHEFAPPSLAYHFNAVKLQNYILNIMNDRVNIHRGNFTSDNIDADFVIDCSGVKEKSSDIFHTAENIPVNSAYVTQCYWDMPRFFYTLAVARPYGWVFGIPLQNRCSIGYMFNSNFNSLEDVKEDVKEIFKQFNLTPSQDTNHLKFGNYYRKENFTDRVGFSGNASFFLEPLEATSIGLMDTVNNLSCDVFSKKMRVEEANKYYQRRIKDIERIICLHYFSGSIFNTDFWRFAKEKGQACISEAVKDRNWVAKIQASKKMILGAKVDSRRLYTEYNYRWEGVEEWSLLSYNNNLSDWGLNIYDKIDKLIDEYK